MKRFLAWIAVVIIAVLLYQNLELRWYREQTIRRLSNRLSTSLQMSGADLQRALEFGRKGDYEAAAQWIGIAEVEIQGAAVAESAYSVALDRWLAREKGHATGFGMALSLYGSEARAARLGPWTPAKEAQLAAMAHDLTLIGEKLSEPVLDRADYGEISAVAEQVKAQLKMAGGR